MPSPETAPSLRALRKLASRNERKRTGLYLAEGIRPVAEALAAGQVSALYHAPDLLTSELGRDLVTAAGQRGIPVVRLTATEFASIASRERPQGLTCVGEQAWLDLDAIPETGVVVGLYQPQDPGNLGSILRTCDAIGGATVVLIGDAVDPWHPGAIRSAMGASFVIPMAKASADEFARWVRTSGLPAIGTSDRADADYAEYRYPESFVLLMGSERQGLPPVLEAVANPMLRIPMAGQVDSLNLAVATSLMLFEARNQHRRAT